MADVGGRPPIWTDPEAFGKEVERYFAQWEDPNFKGAPTWTGLAIHLGFESRQSLEDYKKKEGFSYPIKKALIRIENQYENGLFGRNPAGSIFALKNFGWNDKQEIEQRTTVKDERINEDNLSDDDLRTLAEIQRKSSVRPEEP